MTPATKNPIIELETIVLIIQNKWNGFHIEIVVCFDGGRFQETFAFIGYGGVKYGSSGKYRDINFEKRVIWALAK